MYLADCHVHSRVSADAVHPMTEMAAAALAAGMDAHIAKPIIFDEFKATLREVLGKHAGRT